jgi:hypothetical protein
MAVTLNCSIYVGVALAGGNGDHGVIDCIPSLDGAWGVAVPDESSRGAYSC